MKKALFLFAFLLPQLIYGQQRFIDSLNGVLSQKLPDTVQVDVLDQLAYYHYRLHLDSTRYRAEQGLALARKINYKRGEAANIRNLSIFYNMQGDYPKATQHCLEALEIAQKHNYSAIEEKCWIILSVLSNAQRDYEQAIRYAQGGLAVATKNQSLQNIAINHLNLGNFYNQKKDYQKALYHLKLSKPTNNFFSELYSYLSTSYMGLEDYQNAQKTLDIGFNHLEDQSQRSKVILKYTQALLFYKQKKYYEAIEQATRTLEDIQKSKQNVFLLQTIELISQSYEGLLDNANALKHYKILRIVQDTLLNSERERQILYLKNHFQDEQQKQQIALLEKEKQLQIEETQNHQLIILFFVVGFISLLILFFLLLINNRQKQRTNQLLEQQKSELEAAYDHLKATQAQLVQSEKMAGIGTLTAGIAHEINNPINFVKNNIENVEANLQDILEVVQAYEKITPETAEVKLLEINKLKKKKDFEMAVGEMEELVRGIKEGANRTAEIVRSLRTFTRLDDQDRQLANLHDNIDSTLLLLQNQYKDRLEIVKNYGQIPNVECYIGKINQVFMNLLSNATQAIEGNGTITITTAFLQNFAGFDNPKGFVQIKIWDTGKGIPPEIRDRIFEPFFTTKDVGKGTGLGLSISLGIAQNHKGNLTFESEVGKGTEFVLTLPVEFVA